MTRSDGTRRAGTIGIAVLSLGLVAGCGKSDRPPAADTTSAMAAPQPKAPSGGAAAGGITAALVAQGDSVFHGQLGGGTCFACHGMNAKGSPTGPDLTDATWLHGDGSYESLVQITTTGVPNPLKYPAPMAPMGGANLSPDHVKAVAAYEYSLSHP